MVAMAKLAAAVLGQTTIVNGFTCTPTTPASLNVIVTAGEIYQLENLEASTWSSVSADTTHSILKQGILLDPVTFGITPPGTVGFSQCFLIEAQYSDQDTGSIVIPYFNAANPALPYSGPGNAGTAQNTVRKGVAAVQVKAGLAAATGTQVAPTADAGWAGMFVVTVANGASTITSGNITKLSSAPFIPSTLPNIPFNIQNGAWVAGPDLGSANAYVLTLSPAPTAYVIGMSFDVKFSAANTGASTINVNGLGAKAIVRSSTLAALLANDITAGMVGTVKYDGTQFQLMPTVYAMQQPTGTVSTAKAPKLIGFVANQTGGAGTSVPSATATVIAFNNMAKNNLWGTSTFTSNTTLTIGSGEAGIWNINASIHIPIQATGAFEQIMIWQNGAQVFTGTTTSSVASTGSEVMVTANLVTSVGDTIVIEFYHQYSGSITTGADNTTNFSAFLISAY